MHVKVEMTESIHCFMNVLTALPLQVPEDGRSSAFEMLVFFLLRLPVSLRLFEDRRFPCFLDLDVVNPPAVVKNA